MERVVDASYDALAPLSDPLRVPPGERSFGRQFAQMYDYRLAVLRRRALDAARRDAPDVPYVERLLDIPPRQVCLVVGTFYAEMRLKPDVLQDIARDLSLPPPPPRTSYVDPEHDALYLEDQSGRVKLVGAVRPGGELARHCVTGAVASVVGVETQDGDLDVHQVYFPGLPKPEPPLKAERRGQLVLASGLLAGAADPTHDLARDLLVEWLCGELTAGTGAADARDVSTLVLAGDSVQHAAWAGTDAEHVRDAPNPFAYFDPMLAHVCEALSAVVVLPGAQDPCSAALPQQPLLRTLLPRAARHDSLRLCTNPAWFSVHGRRILATGGQNVADLLKYLPDDAQSPDTALDMATATLAWSHMAPSAPDTLWCYPFKAADAFVIRAAPDLYVIGNQAAFRTAVVPVSPEHSVRVVLVPSFARTQQVVLLDSATLEPRVLSFSTNSSRGSDAGTDPTH